MPEFNLARDMLNRKLILQTGISDSNSAPCQIRYFFKFHNSLLLINSVIKLSFIINDKVIIAQEYMYVNNKLMFIVNFDL